MPTAPFSASFHSHGPKDPAQPDQNQQSGLELVSEIHIRPGERRFLKPRLLHSQNGNKLSKISSLLFVSIERFLFV